MKKLLGLLLRYSPSLVTLAVVASVISGLANTALLALIKNALEAAGHAGQNLIWTFAAMCLVLPAARVAASVLLTSLVQRASYDLRMSLSRKMLGAPLRQLEEVGSDRLLAALTGDVGTISTTLGSIPALAMHLAIVASCLGYLTWLYWPAGLIIVAAVVVGMTMYRLITVRADRHLGTARLELDDLYGHFNALTHGAKELKQHRPRRVAFLDELLHATGAAYRRSNIIGNAYFTAAASMGQLLFFGVIGFLVLIYPKLSPDVTVEVLTAYTLVLLYLVVPLDAISSIAPNFNRAIIALNRIDALGIQLESLNERAAEDEQIHRTWRSLAFRGVVHAYYREKEDRLFSLGPIDLEFRPGELIFLIGGNGSGKTTLAKLILGLYKPDSGEILLDGQPVEDENRDAYRQLFTGVFSDFFLFESLLGINADRVDASAREYLKRLQLDHKIAIENGRLSTLDLSQGQRKRLALLTAYLEDRPIYLFDEWAADQDPVFKEVFYRQLLPELKKRGKTVIAISHDDRYYDAADRVVKLADGQLIDDTAFKPDTADEAPPAI